jgi:hypothetical protein
MKPPAPGADGPRLVEAPDRNHPSCILCRLGMRRGKRGKFLRCEDKGIRRRPNKLARPVQYERLLQTPMRDGSLFDYRMEHGYHRFTNSPSPAPATLSEFSNWRNRTDRPFVPFRVCEMLWSTARGNFQDYCDIIEQYEHLQVGSYGTGVDQSI